MWTAPDIKNKDTDEYLETILNWLSEHEKKDILERADIYVWWQENEGGWKMDEKTKMLVKHAYIMASSQALGSKIEWDENEL